jgi:choline dehydrogenase-like flavoprotein
MVHDAHGWWIREAGGVPPAQPALAEALRADVVVIGGGYTGLWTAWELLEREPEARVVLLEADTCGTGPSGRNGGFLSSLWLYRANMEQQYGERRARELCEASDETLAMIAAFCESRPSTPGCARRRTSSSPARPRRTARARTPSTASTWSRCRRPRRGRSATRRCSAPAWRRGPARPCSRRGWRSGCATGSSRAACGSSRARG